MLMLVRAQWMFADGMCVSIYASVGLFLKTSASADVWGVGVGAGEAVQDRMVAHLCVDQTVNGQCGWEWRAGK